jgi:hypothetical protein
MMAEDVIFTIMATGQEHNGRDGVAGMLAYIYLSGRITGVGAQV